jgi:4-hydroxybenzoyl-CoA reductase beta subunit
MPMKQRRIGGETMRLPRFEHLQPESLEEALDLLSEHREEARVIAGGTDLLVSMKHSLLTPGYLLNLKRLELDFIEEGKEGVRIGALGNLCLNTRCFFYNQSQFWRQARPLCFKTGGETCHVVKGGERCYSAYQGDLAPVLIALGARAKLARKGGERVIPLLDLYTGQGEEPIALEVGEILTEVEIPAPVAPWGGDYQKLRYRGAMDFPLVGVAAVLHLDGGSCAKAKVVLTAVASAPVVVEEASKLLEGQKPDEEAIARAAEAAYEAAHPVGNVGSTPLYRRKMVRVMTQRAIAHAGGRG